MFSNAAPLRRAALAIVLLSAVTGVILQSIASVGFAQARGLSPFFGLWRMLLFFTVLTNILVAAVCLASLRDEKGESFLSSPSTQAATALYIIIVGAIHNLLLADLLTLSGLRSAADFFIHDATPILYVATWLLFLRKGALQWSDALWWLAYPLCYFVYVLVRGAIDNFYPYPFLDVARQGATQVSLNGVALLALFIGLGLAIVAIDRAIKRRFKPA
ncbi:Pr6Pr family membrane protein [Terrarubrum flagellatum]|uniref:Pr6Pr family membrane protein n=1 Tax=Terrirubrum flagellatum TaxID=2895980 RepID=UPI0031453377